MNERPNLFPALDSATEAALTESIRRFGVLVPVVKDQHGNLLDGHHRQRIADELGVSYRVDSVSVASEEEGREIGATLNTDRRQLSPDQRREVVAELREQGHSLRAIGGAVGASKSQVERDLATVPPGTVPDRVTGLDGKSRPSIVASKNVREAERAQEALKTAPVPAGRVIDVKRAERLAREAESEQRRSEPVDLPDTTGEIRVLHGDFRDALADEDLAGAKIITDPPYPREHLDEWRSLGWHGLEWGCVALVAMAGQSILPDALRLIRDSGWEYRWCGAYMTTGPSTRVWGANVGTSWKPILVFDLDGDRKFLIRDIFHPTGDDKRYHRWGQNEDGIGQLVEAFTEPGELVVDPFLGGGTTALVCRDLGRRFVGCDIDADAVRTATERLAA